MNQSLTKKEIIERISGHIKGCTKSKKEYLRKEDYRAAADMKSRIDGLSITLEYVKKIETTTKKSCK